MGKHTDISSELCEIYIFVGVGDGGGVGYDIRFLATRR